MTTEVLDKDKPRTLPFSFTGDCYVCVKGSGTVRFLREMNNEFEVVTNEFGEELSYVGDGVIFNSFIRCGARLKHIVEVATTSQVHVTIERGKS